MAPDERSQADVTGSFPDETTKQLIRAGEGRYTLPGCEVLAGPAPRLGGCERKRAHSAKSPDSPLKGPFILVAGGAKSVLDPGNPSHSSNNKHKPSRNFLQLLWS